MRAIEHFRFCPRCGKASIRAVSEKSVHCWLCDFTLFTNPASAVGAIITDDQGRVLFLKRAKDPRKGKIGAPGGFVDAGESIEEALVREVKEETNLEVVKTTYLCSFPNEYLYHGVRYSTTDVYYTCEVRTLKTLAAMDEVESVQFLSREQVVEEEVAFPSLWRALRVFWAR